MHPGRQQRVPGPASTTLSTTPRPRTTGLPARRTQTSNAPSLARGRLTVAGSQPFKPTGWAAASRRQRSGSSGAEEESGGSGCGDVVAEASLLVRSPPRAPVAAAAPFSSMRDAALPHAAYHAPWPPPPQSGAVTATAQASMASLQDEAGGGAVDHVEDPMLVELPALSPSPLASPSPSPAHEAWDADAEPFGAPGNVAGVDAVRKLF